MENSSPTRSCPAWVSHHVPREFSCFKWHRELPGWWGSSLILFSSLYLSISKEPTSMGSNVAKQKLSLPRGKVHVPELTLRSPGASQPLAPLGWPVPTPGSPPTFHTPKPHARSCLRTFAVPCCSLYLRYSAPSPLHFAPGASPVSPQWPSCPARLAPSTLAGAPRCRQWPFHWPVPLTTSRQP